MQWDKNNRFTMIGGKPVDSKKKPKKGKIDEKALSYASVSDFLRQQFLQSKNLFQTVDIPNDPRAPLEIKNEQPKRKIIFNKLTILVN